MAEIAAERISKAFRRWLGEQFDRDYAE